MKSACGMPLLKETRKDIIDNQKSCKMSYVDLICKGGKTLRIHRQKSKKDDERKHKNQNNYLEIHKSGFFIWPLYKVIYERFCVGFRSKT